MRQCCGLFPFSAILIRIFVFAEGFVVELERLERERLENLENGIVDTTQPNSKTEDYEAAKEKDLMDKIEDAKERLAAMERMKKGRSVGSQTSTNDKSSREIYDNIALTVKFDTDGVPSLAPSTKLFSASLAASSSQVWLLPCLRRTMLCYSGQKASILPPNLFLAYFQEIIHYRLRFPVRPACAEGGGGEGVGVGGKGGAAGRDTSEEIVTKPSIITASSPSLSLRATVASMRQLRRSNTAAIAPSTSSATLSSISSFSYTSCHNSVKMSWRSPAATFDGFAPGQASFPDYALRFFQTVFGQKASADIM
jgi:hypothetical protein